jgi:hypothetical protein
VRNLWWSIVMFPVALAVTASEAQADGMRCGRRLVSSGDSLYRVRSVCGEPDDAQRRVVTQTERRRVRVPCGERRTESRCERTEEYSRDVVVDEWTYDFGEQRFIRYLTFVDGRLESVSTGSYGSSNSE